MHVAPCYADEVVDAECDARQDDEEYDDDDCDNVVLLHLESGFPLIRNGAGPWAVMGS